MYVGVAFHLFFSRFCVQIYCFFFKYANGDYKIHNFFTFMHNYLHKCKKMRTFAGCFEK